MAYERQGRKPLFGEGDEDQFVEKVVHINRVAKVVKGGRRFSFIATVFLNIGTNDPRAALGKNFGGRRANSRRRAGNNSDFIV